MDLIAYLRVSTDKQAEEGYGLDVQADDVAAYAAANGHTIVATYTDEGVSGSNGLALREALPEALLALAAGNGQALLIPALHRLSRDMLLQEQLLREIWSMGCEVLSALGSEASLRDDPEDPARRMLRVILGAVNEYERTLIVLRLREPNLARPFKAGNLAFAFALGVGPAVLIGYALYASRAEKLMGSTSALLFAVVVALLGPALYWITAAPKARRLAAAQASAAD